MSKPAGKSALDDAADEVLAAEAAQYDPKAISDAIGALPTDKALINVELHVVPLLKRISRLRMLPQEACLKQLKAKTGLSLGALKACLAEQGDPQLQGDVEVGERGYIDAYKGVGISTFLLEPISRVLHDGGEEMLEATIRNPQLQKTSTILLPASAFQSRSQFQRHFRTYDFQFSGSDDNLQAIAQRLSHAQIPSRRGTSTLGYHDFAGDPRWVGPGIMISTRGVNVDTDLACVNHHPSIGDKLHYPVVDALEVQTVARAALPLLIAMNAAGLVLLALAWFVASVFKVQLHKELGHFPILMVAGTQGSGKTSTLEQLCRLVGLGGENNKPFSIAGSRFVLVKLLSATSSVPVFLDEYKPAELEPRQLARVHHLLRQVYGGEIEERGRADLSVNQLKLQAPVVIAGEAEVADDPALRERIVLVRTSKQALHANQNWRRAFATLSGLKLEVLAVPLIQFSLEQDVGVWVGRARMLLALAGPRGGELPIRQHDNLLVEVFGLMMLKEFATRHGVTLELDVAVMVSTFVDQVLDGARGAKDVFDDFIAECATYAREGALLDGVHYVFVDGMLRIQLASCHQVYLEKRTRTQRRDATNGLSALRRIVSEKLERNEYVTSIDARARLEGSYARTIEIDPRRIPPHLHIETFPKGNDRRHGGSRPIRPGAEDSIHDGPDQEPDLSAPTGPTAWGPASGRRGGTQGADAAGEVGASADQVTSEGSKGLYSCAAAGGQRVTSVRAGLAAAGAGSLAGQGNRPLTGTQGLK